MVFRIASLFNYIVSPFPILLVNDWITKKPHGNDMKFPWKLLNEDCIPPLQLILCVIYFSVMLVSVWSQKYKVVLQFNARVPSCGKSISLIMPKLSCCCFQSSTCSNNHSANTCWRTGIIIMERASNQLC